MLCPSLISHQHLGGGGAELRLMPKHSDPTGNLNGEIAEGSASKTRKERRNTWGGGGRKRENGGMEKTKEYGGGILRGWKIDGRTGGRDVASCDPHRLPLFARYQSVDIIRPSPVLVCAYITLWWLPGGDAGQPLGLVGDP